MAASASVVDTPRSKTAIVHRIQPSSGLVLIDLHEVWRYRELLYHLLLRDVKSRYKQTFLGPFWAIFRPFATMVLFAALFGGLAHIASGSDLPYLLFVAPGVLAFTYFSSALTGTASSILNNSSLLAKAYFPRVYAPLSSALTPLVDLMLSLIVMVGLFVYYQQLPSWHVVFLPLFMVLTALVALSIGLWLAGVTVRYRDVAFALPFVIQIWQYATPVIYPVSFVPQKYQWLLALNPMTAVVEGFRWSLLGTPLPNVNVLLGSAAFSVVLTIGGLFFFRRTERTIMDLL